MARSLADARCKTIKIFTYIVKGVSRPFNFVISFKCGNAALSFSWSISGPTNTLVRMPEGVSTGRENVRYPAFSKISNNSLTFF